MRYSAVLLNHLDRVRSGSGTYQLFEKHGSTRISGCQNPLVNGSWTTILALKMRERDHTQQTGFRHAGEGYTIIVRKPGAQHITVPEGVQFLDIYLGRSVARYEISVRPEAGTSAPPSTIVFLPAGQEYEISASRSGWSVQMCFETDRLRDALSHLLGVPKSSLDPDVMRAICHEEDPVLVGIAQTLAGVWSADIALPDTLQLDAVARLFIMGVALRFALHSRPRLPVDSASPRIQPVLDHIEANLADPLSLDSLASIAGVSPYHFARLFRRYMGRSPHKYVIERRVARARRKLNQSDDPIALIAHDCGFSSQSHMTDAFGTVIGVTPGVIRKGAL